MVLVYVLLFLLDWFGMVGVFWCLLGVLSCCWFDALCCG